MKPEVWAEIKRLAMFEKLTVAEIARRLLLDRKTVRRALRRERCPVKQYPPRPSMLDSFKPYIAERLQAHPRLPATVLLQEIQRQGYTGKIRILTEHIQNIRQDAREVYLRIETPPGEQAQVDWANCGTLRVGNALRKLSCFVMVLSHSRLMYVEFTLSQCLEDFIQAHINAFRFIQGIPRKILYDNLKLVVLSRNGAHIQFNPKFMEFAALFSFEPVPCHIRRGNEKGKVENGIRYLRTSFLAGRDITSWPQVQSQARAWLDEVANARLHRTTREKPIDRWQKEKPFLQILPSVRYDASLLRCVRATHQAQIRFDGNVYSVPHRWAYHTLTLRADSAHVRLLAEAEEIAVHPRSYDRGIFIENPKHYEGLLIRKRKAFSQHLQRHFLTLGDAAEEYLKGLLAQERHPHRHIHRILDLATTYGRQQVLAAIRQALSSQAFGAAYIHNILLQARAAQGQPEILPLAIPNKPHWNDIFTEEPDLSVYDKLMDDPPSQKKSSS
jgi:transposase